MAASLPRITLAIPTLVALFHRPGWVYEEKVDGWRIVAYKQGADVRLISRTGQDHTKRFLDVARAIAQLPARSLILDGEVAVFDERLVSRFDRIGGTAPERITPPIYIAFDVLWLNGRDLRAKPLRERRRILERVVDAHSPLVLPCRRLPADGAEAWAEVQRRGYEGLVAKDDAAPYRGGPSRTWLKSKQRHEGTFLVGGVGLGGGVRGLLVGALVAGELVYRGTVEFGVSSAMLKELAGSPLATATSPFADLKRRRGVTWIEPKVAVEVQYNDLTGGRLRAPVLRVPARGCQGRG